MGILCLTGGIVIIIRTIVSIIISIVPRSVFTNSSSIKHYQEDKRLLVHSDPWSPAEQNSKCPVTFLAPNVGPGAPNQNSDRTVNSKAKNYQLIYKICMIKPKTPKSGKVGKNIKIIKNHQQYQCAGLNPLPCTIQGNDPGTTACPPCAG